MFNIFTDFKLPLTGSEKNLTLIILDLSPSLINAYECEEWQSSLTFVCCVKVYSAVWIYIGLLQQDTKNTTAWRAWNPKSFCVILVLIWLNKAPPFEPCLDSTVELLTVKYQKTDSNSFIVIMLLWLSTCISGSEFYSASMLLSRNIF